MDEWKSLGATLSGKPLVLAGPILRKVTPTSVTVWLAMKKFASVELMVADASNSPVLYGKAEAVSVGTNLHIVAITATAVPGKGPLTAGVVYQYDLAFDLGNNSTLNMEGAIGSTAQLHYPPFTKPTFALPPADLNLLRILHGSCRMPHAAGQDMLAPIDDLIKTTANNAFARPHQLLLTGDQIYADDVSDSLLLILSDAAEVLMGWREQLPGVSTDPKWGGDPVPPTLRTPVLGGPKVNVTSTAGLSPGFSSDSMRSHLMSLGEYLCMYLFVWSDIPWPDFMPSLSHIKNRVAAAKQRGAKEVLEDEAYNEIPGLTQLVAEFSQTLSKVRRALANIPTYMIFDDHEVTDDWNMTRDFCAQVYSHPLGARVVQNALTAYALCQHWGNAPEQFESPKAGRQLINILDPPMSRPAGVPKTFNTSTAAARYDQMSATIRGLVGLQDSAVTAQRQDNALYHDANSLAYHYTIEGESHQIVVTDTRTWRSYPGGTDKPSILLPPDLLNIQIRNTLPLQIPAQGQQPARDRVLLVVLSTNAPAVQPIRSAARNAGIARRFKHFPDVYESWEAPTEHFDRLLRALTDKLPAAKGKQHYGQIVLLSGDVHFSFASRMIYRANVRFDDTTPQPTTAVIAQLVASAFKNETGDTQGFQSDGYTFGPFKAKAIGTIPKHVPEGYVGWNVRAGTPLNVGTVETWTSAGGQAYQFKHKIKDPGPTLALWIVDPLSSVHFSLDKQPDYRYLLQYLLPLRDDGPTNVTPIPALPAGATPEQRKEAARSFNAAHANYRKYSRSPSSAKLVGKNNFSEMTFHWGADDHKAVRHTVRWMLNPQTQIATTYLVSFDPSYQDFKDIPELKDKDIANP